MIMIRDRNLVLIKPIELQLSERGKPANYIFIIGEQDILTIFVVAQSFKRCKGHIQGNCYENRMDCHF